MSGSYWCQRTDTTTSYTVTARRDQAERWEAAAAVDGRRGAVGSWLAETADAHLQERARTGLPPALTWFQGYFRVLVTDTTVRPEVTGEIEVGGEVSGPFGVFRGDRHGRGEPGCCSFSLVHLPTHRIIGTLPLRKSCKALAAELAVLRVHWQETDPEKVLVDAPDQGKAQALLRLFKKLTDT
jgi:hypothetical protein